MIDRTTLLFALPGFRVLNVTLDPDGGRVVLVESVSTEGGCPSCGVMSSRVKDRPICRLKNLPHGEDFHETVEVHLRMMRYAAARLTLEPPTSAVHIGVPVEGELMRPWTLTHLDFQKLPSKAPVTVDRDHGIEGEVVQSRLGHHGHSAAVRRIPRHFRKPLSIAVSRYVAQLRETPMTWPSLCRCRVSLGASRLNPSLEQGTSPCASTASIRIGRS
jgi:hypothetical protein